MRRAAKVDATQAIQVDALRKAGCLVLLWPGGPVDAIVLRRRYVQVGNHGTLTSHVVKLFDFKTNLRKRGRRVKLTDTQHRLLGEGWPICFTTTPEEALLAMDFTP